MAEEDWKTSWNSAANGKLGSVSPERDFSQFNSSYTKPDGSLVFGFNNSALPGQKPLGSEANDMSKSYANNYLNALKDQQAATAAARDLSGGSSALPNPTAIQTPTATTSSINTGGASWRNADGSLKSDTQKASPGFNPDQAKAFFGMIGQMMGAQPGLNQVATSNANNPTNPYWGSSFRNTDGSLK